MVKLAHWVFTLHDFNTRNTTDANQCLFLLCPAQIQFHHCQVVYLTAKYKEVRSTPRMAETFL